MEILHANIFFIITTVAIIVVTVGIAIALYYVIAILRDVKDVTKTVEKTSEELAQDVRDLRAGFKQKRVWRTIIGKIIHKRHEKKDQN